MKNRLPVVLVTGASGFVGRHLTRALARSGWTVRRAVRTSSGSDDEVVIESIGPTTDWQQALAGVHAVVHLAARVHHPQQEHAIELYRNVNIEGTLQLARCAADLGVRELIFVSTVLVHGRSNNSHAPFRESDHLTPRGLYGMSKAAAEAGLKTLAEASDVNITVVRPPLVYGSGAKGNFRVLVKAVRSGFPLPFAGIRNRRAFVAVENLTSFIEYRLSHPAGKFDIFQGGVKFVICQFVQPVCYVSAHLYGFTNSAVDHMFSRVECYPHVWITHSLDDCVHRFGGITTCHRRYITA